MRVLPGGALPAGPTLGSAVRVADAMADAYVIANRYRDWDLNIKRCLVAFSQFPVRLRIGGPGSTTFRSMPPGAFWSLFKRALDRYREESLLGYLEHDKSLCWFRDLRRRIGDAPVDRVQYMAHKLGVWSRQAAARRNEPQMLILTVAEIGNLAAVANARAIKFRRPTVQALFDEARTGEHRPVNPVNTELRKRLVMADNNLKLTERRERQRAEDAARATKRLEELRAAGLQPLEDVSNGQPRKRVTRKRKGA